MLFSSPTFLFLFLPALFLLNLLFRKRVKWSNALLIAASLLFYAWGEPVYVLLMVATTLVSWGLARLVERFPERKKLFGALAALWGVGILVFFKYTDFLIGSFNAFTGLSLPLVGVALPIGISFFTFEAMSYVFDVYRGDAKAARNYFDVLLYISLFPQILAGPIVRYGDIAAQLHAREAAPEDMALGFRRFCFGMAKKALIANTLSLTANAVFALPGTGVNAPIAWLGAVAYLLQIYFDFSGYSDMAIGLGRAFGFKLRENFNYPYAALSMQDFWRRWHISLSSWFRDYVYIPMGGNRKGKLRTGLNKLIVFLLTGLWHGASWTFAAWGLYHGGFLMLESYGVLKPDRWPRILQRIYTLLAVTVGFVLFRADTFAGALTLVGSMFAGWSFTSALMAELSMLLTPLCVAALAIGALASTPLAHRLGEKLEAKKGSAVIAAYAGAFMLFILSVLCLSTSSYNPFIYFKF
ncbi:MAG TPA: MBOAT family O-acyltransferase [Clostridia bacterium]|nr:MBOAT family O-acyltransferase [Clostridia bacterium]